ncbi:conserved protein of unknown function [Ectopseudomonas oleovorans]|uniref:Uncharacterized protein n=1 Tax=Ectopseudomonas oleovorans TaxID=301 RepID=A0A653B0N5_ECTOL|nr:conserved protein of unknown function [Pseudomonas oleovorans]
MAEFSSSVAQNNDRLSPTRAEISLSLRLITDEFKFDQETRHDIHPAPRCQCPPRPCRQGRARLAQP